MPGLSMTENSTTMKQIETSSSRQSLLTAMNKFVQAVEEMDDTVMIPSRLRDLTVKDPDTPPNSNGKAVLPMPLGKTETASHIGDLYSFYTTLNAIKTELVRGPRPEAEDDDDEAPHVDEQAQKSAQMFRHHLKGLFSVLKQLTDTAEHLTTRYQEEVVDLSSPARLTTFTV